MSARTYTKADLEELVYSRQSRSDAKAIVTDRNNIIGQLKYSFEANLPQRLFTYSFFRNSNEMRKPAIFYNYTYFCIAIRANLIQHT
ncbi:hypothetical protein D3C71_1043480 [compost metagenome]